VPLRDRGDALRFLAGAARPRLVAAARRAAAARHAEDAVQDVLARLAAGAGRLPAEPDALTAYATVAVRRQAVALARAEGAPAALLEPAAGVDADPVAEHESRRALAAYVAALDGLPERTRAALALDAAGWPREAVGRAVGASGRAVKRIVDEHRAAVLARAARALDGSDCARLAETLAAYGAGAGRPRPDGPVARHLEVCDACRAALAAERRTRRALRGLLPLPLAGPLVAPRHGAGAAARAGGVHALAAKVLAGAALVAGGGAVALQTSAGSPPPPARQPAAPLARTTTVAAPRLVPAGPAVATAGAEATRAGRRALARTPAPVRRRPSRRTAPAAAPAAPGGCGYGTLRDCAVADGLGSLG
jgi:DNA-directed RNA polymerase specialized sigma24 family protein